MSIKIGKIPVKIHALPIEDRPLLRVAEGKPVLGEDPVRGPVPVELGGFEPFSISVAPSMNICLRRAISSAFFLPMALRSVSAWPMVKPPMAEAICITCSWYRMTP